MLKKLLLPLLLLIPINSYAQSATDWWRTGVSGTLFEDGTVYCGNAYNDINNNIAPQYIAYWANHLEIESYDDLQGVIDDRVGRTDIQSMAATCWAEFFKAEKAMEHWYFDFFPHYYENYPNLLGFNSGEYGTYNTWQWSENFVTAYLRRLRDMTSFLPTIEAANEIVNGTAGYTQDRFECLWHLDAGGNIENGSMTWQDTPEEAIYDYLDYDNMDTTECYFIDTICAEPFDYNSITPENTNYISVNTEDDTFEYLIATFNGGATSGQQNFDRNDLENGDIVVVFGYYNYGKTVYHKYSGKLTSCGEKISYDND